MSTPVRVALDAQALQVDGYADRGIGRYVAGYASALHRRGVLAAALLAPELPPPSGLPSELVASGLAGWDGAAMAGRLLERPEPLVLHHTAPFLHSGPGQNGTWLVGPHWSRLAVPRVTLVHDLIPLRAPRHYLAAPGHEERYRARAGWVADSDLIVTNSEYTRQEVVDLLGCPAERVVTIGVGVSRFFTGPDRTDDELWRHWFPQLEHRPFVLTVGGSDARKGTDRAVAAIGQAVLRGLDLCLFVVGHLTDEWQRALRETAQACGVADRIVLAGAIDDEVLRAGYRRAVVSVMPSLAEGAGLPVLESAASGTPALASSTSALGEMAACPEAVFDPTDVDAIALAIVAAVESEARRTRILDAQRALVAVSTWDAVAGRAIDAIDHRFSGRSGLSAPPPALAIVGWPTGVDDDRRDALIRSWPGPVELIDHPDGFGTDIRPASFDHVLYVMSAAEEDGVVASLARRHPGWVWLSGAGSWRGRGVDRLVRCSRGVLVDSEADRRAVVWQLRPLSAAPPVVVVEGGAPAGVVATLTA